MTPRKSLIGLALFLLAAFLTGCSTFSPLAVPIRPAPYRVLPPDEPAMIRVPVMVDLPDAAMLGKGAVQVAKKGSQQVIPGVTHLSKVATYQIWKDPLALKVSGDVFSTSMKLHYMVTSGAQKAIAKEVLIKARSAVNWDKSWHLGSQISLIPRAEAAEGKSAPPREITEWLGREGEKILREGTAQFDERLFQLSNLQPRAKELWEIIQEPIYLDRGIWLVIHPGNVGAGQTRITQGKPPKMQTLFQMTAYPKILFGSRPLVDKVALPPLQHLKPGYSGFRAVSNLKISFKEATRLVKDLHTGIVGHVFKESGERKLKITGIRFYGSGGQLIVEAQLQYNPLLLNLSDKPAELVVYLRGTPRFRADRQVFDFPDLDFDVKTSDFLVQVAEWMFKADIQRDLRKKAKIPVGNKLADIKKRMTDVLNRPLGPHAKLSTRVDSLKVLEAFVSDEGIEGRVSLEGDANLRVNWK